MAFTRLEDATTTLKPSTDWKTYELLINEYKQVYCALLGEYKKFKGPNLTSTLLRTLQINDLEDSLHQWEQKIILSEEYIRHNADTKYFYRPDHSKTAQRLQWINQNKAEIAAQIEYLRGEHKKLIATKAAPPIQEAALPTVKEKAESIIDSTAPIEIPLPTLSQSTVTYSELKEIPANDIRTPEEPAQLTKTKISMSNNQEQNPEEKLDEQILQGSPSKQNLANVYNEPLLPTPANVESPKNAYCNGCCFFWKTNNTTRIDKKAEQFSQLHR